MGRDWDFSRLINQYLEQIRSVSELLPPEFDVGIILKKFREIEIKRAKKLIREGKTKE
jgi:hypothetical protein